VTVPIGLTWGGNSHLPTSSSMQSILNIQRTLAKSTIVEFGYLGSQSRHLYYLVNQNQGILNASLPVVQRLPYPEWGASANPMAECRRQRQLQRLQREVNATLGRHESERSAFLYLVEVPG